MDNSVGEGGEVALTKLADVGGGTQSAVGNTIPWTRLPEPCKRGESLLSTIKEHVSVHFCLFSAMDTINLNSCLKLLPQKLPHSDVLLDKINPFLPQGAFSWGTLSQQQK